MDQDTTNQNTQNQSTAPAAGTAPVLPATTNSTGPVIGIIVIVLILALGGLYFWYDTHPSEQALAPTTDESAQASDGLDAVLDALTTTSSQDTASAIEADLSATNIGDASSDLQVQ